MEIRHLRADVGSAFSAAQSLDDLNIQIHGYATQGFLYSTNNNVLTTNSSNGSPAWDEAVRLDKDGRPGVVINGKWLNDVQRRSMVYDIERGKARGILPQPWQTDTCIGSWHYDREHFQISLLQIRRVSHQHAGGHREQEWQPDVERAAGGDGQPDSDEIKIVGGIGAWLKINGEAIYATRPWKVYGEGPSTDVQRRVRSTAGRSAEKAVHGRRHSLHAVQGRQGALRHRAGNSKGRQM